MKKKAVKSKEMYITDTKTGVTTKYELDPTEEKKISLLIYFLAIGFLIGLGGYLYVQSLPLPENQNNVWFAILVALQTWGWGLPLITASGGVWLYERIVIRRLIQPKDNK